MSVASLAADPFRIRLLEGLSREERDSILGAASYRRLSRHTVVTNQADRAITCFFSSKALPGISSSHQAARKYVSLACLGRDSRRRDPSSGTIALSRWHRNCQRQLRARLATQHDTNSGCKIPKFWRTGWP